MRWSNRDNRVQILAGVAHTDTVVRNSLPTAQNVSFPKVVGEREREGERNEIDWREELNSRIEYSQRPKGDHIQFLAVASSRAASLSVFGQVLVIIYRFILFLSMKQRIRILNQSNHTHFRSLSLSKYIL